VELANEQVLKSWGKDRTVLGKPLREIIPASQYEEFKGLLERVFTTGIPYTGTDMPVTWGSDNHATTHYVDFTYQPVRNSAGNIYGILSTAVEVTEKVLAKKAIKESEQNLLNIILQAPVAMCILHGPSFMVQIANGRMYELWGRGEAELLGKPLFEVLPEASGQGFEDLLKGVYTTGETFAAYGIPVNLPRNNNIETIYINLLYEAFRGADGSISGIMAVATDVTAQVLAGKKIEESEQNLRSLVESAPFPIGVYTGKEMRITLANQSILDVWGKGYDVIGKPYSTVLPELENQQIFEQLDQVYNTGIPFHAKNQRVDLMVDGRLVPYYFNYSFTPLYDDAGQVYGVMNTAADVTDMALASQQIIEAEASLRSAIELAELGTWSVDLETRTLIFSDRLCEWSGFEPGIPITLEQALTPIPGHFLAAIKEAGVRAIDPQSDGIFDVEYSLINQKTGKEHILHAQGKPFTREGGAVYRFAGTAQDITRQRKLQHELELQVQQRTAELQAVNAELAEANDQLQHSNEELAQYAYVASHDLQEPLRKIRIFSGLLHGQKDLTDQSKQLVAKMDAASERMVMLIKDLLEFSRLLNSETMVRPIDLTEVCRAVVADFEVNIAEKGATVEIGKLPAINAVALQMNQLFYNLLSNALKFTRPDVTPRISISASVMSSEAITKYIAKPNDRYTYYDITVQDNGIGFDAEYADQIFEVFKRLHGRDIYPGSGVGLALCRRIAANQKGHLYAVSTTGAGSTFHVLLPDRRSDGTD
jgi:PAS domain S-box-containing protein